jgi:hypothetical protein
VSSKMALPVALAVVVLLAMWPAGNVLSQNTCPGCSEPAKVIHPSGFGSHSYARWKTNVGLADSGGSVNFAMYMQHLTPATETSAGRAVVAIEGFDSEPVGIAPGVTSLEFYVRLTNPSLLNPSGVECTTTSPRFSVRYRIPNIPDQFYNTTGCAFMSGTTILTAPNGSQYLQRTFTVPPTLGAIIVSIAILFDDPVQPFSHIDNISVTDGTGVNTWTRPADNGSN